MTSSRTALASLWTLLAASAALKLPEPNVNVGRRGAIGAAAAALLAAGPPQSAVATEGGGPLGIPTEGGGPLGIPTEHAPGIDARGTTDPLAHWSFFGLAPPPISGHLSYSDLLDRAKYGQIASVQIAVQHDCVVATTTQGHRLACPLPDKEFPRLLLESMRPDGTYPFDVLPMDASRAKVRDGATALLNLFGVLWVADLADLLPWDTATYNSLAEKEEGKKAGKPLKPLVDKLFGPALHDEAGIAAQKEAAATEHEKALKDVFGMSKKKTPAGDEAAEAAEAAKKQKPAYPPDLGTIFSVDELKRKLAELAEALPTLPTLPSKASLKADLKAAMPAMPSKASLKAKAQEIKSDHEPAWVTPYTADGTLPTLKELFAGPVHVGDGQYIRAHPAGPDVRAEASALAAPMGAALEKLAATATKARGVSFDAGHLGVCRLCPAFTKFYGHNVYICRRADAPASA